MLAIRSRALRLTIVLGAVAALALPAAMMAATITGTTGPDRLVGTSSDDTIYGLAGNDAIFGLAGNDHLYGGAGADRIFGGRGADSIWGGDGPDLLVGGAGRDSIHGGAGWDVIVTAGDGAADTVACGTGNDYVIYGPGDIVGADCEHKIKLPY